MALNPIDFEKLARNLVALGYDYRLADVLQKAFSDPSYQRESVQAVDSSSVALPSGAGATIDGVVVAENDRVLFTNLSAGSNKVYQVTGVGSSIVWSVALDGRANGAPQEGDQLYCEAGTDNGDHVWIYNGAAWVNTAAADPLVAVLTGFEAAAGTVTDADTILTALEKIAANAAAALPKAGGAMTGNLQMSAAQAYIDVPAVMTPSGTTQTINWNNGNYQVIDLGSATGDVTLSYSNQKAGAAYILEVIQGATPRNLIFPAGHAWANGEAPTISTSDDAVDVISILCKTTSVFRCSFNQAFA
jgi:hypothetical protein